MICFIWQKHYRVRGRDSERERKQERERKYLSSVSSLLKWLQWPELGHTQARNWEIRPVFVGAGAHAPGPSSSGIQTPNLLLGNRLEMKQPGLEPVQTRDVDVAGSNVVCYYKSPASCSFSILSYRNDSIQVSRSEACDSRKCFPYLCSLWPI